MRIKKKANLMEQRGRIASRNLIRRLVGLDNFPKAALKLALRGFVPGVHEGNLVDRHAMRSERNHPPLVCIQLITLDS
ncbi:hypothetical protein TNCV_1181741 [Trichonephila clavipes]|nr:hypothetical protein TNCV_1181741 [Trichonephila clavipes]